MKIKGRESLLPGTSRGAWQLEEHARCAPLFEFQDLGPKRSNLGHLPLEFAATA
jgi:hypothetical protein